MYQILEFGNIPVLDSTGTFHEEYLGLIVYVFPGKHSVFTFNPTAHYM